MEMQKESELKLLIQMDWLIHRLIETQMNWYVEMHSDIFCHWYSKIWEVWSLLTWCIYDSQTDEESENGFIIEDDDFFDNDFSESDMGPEEAVPHVESHNCQQTAPSTSAVPNATQDVVAPSQDFFQTLNSQVSS